MVANAGILLRMERVEQGASDEVGRPDHRRRLHEIATEHSTNREADLYNYSEYEDPKDHDQHTSCVDIMSIH